MIILVKYVIANRGIKINIFLGCPQSLTTHNKVCWGIWIDMGLIAMLENACRIEQVRILVAP